MTKRLNVSRMTINKIIDDLAREGLVYGIQGKGTFVFIDFVLNLSAYGEDHGFSRGWVRKG